MCLDVGFLLAAADVVRLAEERGWRDSGAGAVHPVVLRRRGSRPEPVRATINSRREAELLLRQLDASLEEAAR